jgi:hypothetical protein
MADQNLPSSVDGVARETELPRPVLLVFAQIDSSALGIASGSVCGLWLFLATMILVLRGGERIGQNLSLLNQYFPGFSVSLPGALVGLLYGAATGFVLGYMFARIRNFLVRTYLLYLRRRGEQEVLSDFLDRMT